MTKYEEKSLKIENERLKIHNKALTEQINQLVKKQSKVSAETYRKLVKLGVPEREIIKLWQIL